MWFDKLTTNGKLRSARPELVKDSAVGIYSAPLVLSSSKDWAGIFQDIGFPCRNYLAGFNEV